MAFLLESGEKLESHITVVTSAEHGSGILPCSQKEGKKSLSIKRTIIKDS